MGYKTFMPQKARTAEMEIRFSRSESNSIPAWPAPLDLGKNLDNIKIWLPQKMANYIDALAHEADSSRSVYIRQGLIRQVFGRMQMPKQRRAPSPQCFADEGSC